MLLLVWFMLLLALFILLLALFGGESAEIIDLSDAGLAVRWTKLISISEEVRLGVC
jgi:hypothetical protein